MELLAPAGGWEQLEYAINFGADAVYLASQRYGMRHRADNFTEEDLPAAIAYAHEQGVHVHVTVNTVMTDADTDDLPRYFRLLADAGADAFIVADAGAIAIAHEVAPQVPIHLSTQSSCMNAVSARLYRGFGVTRIVVAREMSLAQIAEMRRRLPSGMQIEAFGHGSMCMAYSGRCLISDYLVGRERSADKGNCSQPCRWKYALVEETRPGQYFEVEEDVAPDPAQEGSTSQRAAGGHGTFIMSSNDMCMLEHLDDMQAAGIDSIKLEGRAKGAFYVATVVNAYRHVLDGAPASAWMGELDTTSHRPFSTGFYYGDPGQNLTAGQYRRVAQMVGTVTGCAPEGDAWRAEFTCRNRLFEGDAFEVMSPACDIRPAEAQGLVWHAAPDADTEDLERDGCPVLERSADGSVDLAVPVANRTMEQYSLLLPFPVKPRDIFRIRPNA